MLLAPARVLPALVALGILAMAHPLSAAQPPSAADGQARSPAADALSCADAPPPCAESDSPPRYADDVQVQADAPAAGGHIDPSRTLDGLALRQLSGVTLLDPMRAAQALPGVAQGDDFRSEFAVRGAGPAQTGFIFEGVATGYLLHTVQQVRDGGSLAMVNADAVDQVTLRPSAYAPRFGRATGAELEFALREGRRDRTHVRATVSAIGSSVTADGPVGRAARGAWLVAARASYLDPLLTRVSPDQPVHFGFRDVQTKLVRDLGASSRVEFAGTAGHSRLELVPDTAAGVNDLRTAFNDAAIGVVTLRVAPRARVALVTRLSGAVQQFRNTSRDGALLDDGGARDLVWRTEGSGTVAATAWHVAVEARDLRADGRQQRIASGRPQDRAAFASASGTVGGEADVTRRWGRIIAAAGARADHWTLVHRAAVSPWAMVSRTWRHALTVRAAVGTYRQVPTADQVVGLRGTADLRVPRARQSELRVSQPLAGGWSWDVAVYDRQEVDGLRLPGADVLLRGTVVVPVSFTTRWQNALATRARGAEWLVGRTVGRGLGGWVSYAYSHTAVRDVQTGERFDGDYDQRHTVNAVLRAALPPRWQGTLVWRAGSGMPAVGYWAARGPQWFVASTRNALRVPSAARLDASVSRRWTRRGVQVDAVAEVANLLGRKNVRAVPPGINRTTGEVTGLFADTLPRVPSVGLTVAF